MQKSADKLIKKQLEEETEESLKEALKKSILSPSERKAAGETAKNVMEKRFREMGRAEVFKPEFPEFIGKEGTGAERREHKTVIGYMEKITKKLEEEFGDKFIAIALEATMQEGTLQQPAIWT